TVPATPEELTKSADPEQANSDIGANLLGRAAVSARLAAIIRFRPMDFPKPPKAGAGATQIARKRTFLRDLPSGQALSGDCFSGNTIGPKRSPSRAAFPFRSPICPL